MRLNAITAAVACSVVLFVFPVAAQVASPDLLAKGLGQLSAARSQHTDAAYQAAEDTFTTLLTADPSNAQALVSRGSARVMRGVLSLSTSVREATERFQSGMADMDRAVSLAPADLRVRLTRGLSYVEFPPSYNKREIARGDLEIAIRHTDFGSLPSSLREQAQKALVRATPSSDPSSEVTPRDRFARVAATTSPIIAVASVTFERMRPDDKPAWLETIMETLYQSPGMLAAHTAVSFDNPGMFLIFTWWTNKQALNDFYFSDAHQDWIRGRGEAIAGVATRAYAEKGPTQVGIELFSTLPGGMALGGGFVPRSVRHK